MQGIIFNALEEFVLDAADMEVWNDVIEQSQVASGGAYTAGVLYDDAEIVALASTLCDKLGVSLADGLKLFGKFLFGFLLNRGPIELKEYKDTQSLLADLEDVIHKDVKRIHPDAYTPFFEFRRSNDNEGELIYRSDRKMCAVAEGLVEGAAEHFGQQVSMVHTHCTHNGDNDCHWQLSFQS
jgi:predicted hydrocarbon binding protein